jgi:hemoglobin-like flavoprotein
MMDKEQVRKLRRSYSRCFIGEKNLIDKFYHEFLTSSPEIAPHFENTDFKQQILLLRQGINCMLMFAEGVYAGEFCLGEIQLSHNKKHLNIHPHLYVFWKESLLKVLKKEDPEFNEELYQLWEEALDYGIKYIAKGY